MSAETDPVLVVESRLERRRLMALAAATTIVLIGVAGSFAYWVLTAPITSRLGPGALCILGPVIALVTAAVGFAVNKWEFSRFGRVEFRETSILFLKRSTRHGRTEVAWSELVAFSDDSADHVDLIRRDDHAASTWDRNRPPNWILAVPTPDDRTRAEVLAILDARGLRRADQEARP